MAKETYLTQGMRDEHWIKVATEEIAYRTAEIKRLEDLKKVGWAATMTESLDYMIGQSKKKLADAKRTLAQELAKA